jgi:DDE superfamily endonuclease
VVLDNYGTHTHAAVQAWLAKHPRVQLHCTPTSASWMHLVEVFFSIITRQAIRRGSFPSVADLVAAIGRFCDAWNERCHPFVWSKTPTTSWSRQPLNEPQVRNTRALDDQVIGGATVTVVVRSAP